MLDHRGEPLSEVFRSAKMGPLQPRPPDHSYRLVHAGLELKDEPRHLQKLVVILDASQLLQDGGLYGPSPALLDALRIDQPSAPKARAPASQGGAAPAPGEDSFVRSGSSVLSLMDHGASAAALSDHRRGDVLAGYCQK